MIRRTRGPEPPALAAARALRLPSLRSLRAVRELSSNDFPKKDYRHAFAELYRQQRGICCYCESWEQSRKNPVEHIRPKTKVDHEQGAGEVEGYWWLAYSWENLAFACRTCNEQPYKHTRFPLALGSPRLVAEQAPPGAEQALFINPFDEDPGPWIEFVFSPLADGWIPQPRAGRPREKGEATIRVLGLRRPELREQRDGYVRHHVMPAIRRIQRVLLSDDVAAVTTTWQDELDHLFHEGARFQALSRDVLGHYISAAQRARFGLVFPAHVTLP